MNTPRLPRGAARGFRYAGIAIACWLCWWAGWEMAWATIEARAVRAPDRVNHAPPKESSPSAAAEGLPCPDHSPPPLRQSVQREVVRDGV
jgi:hypothetical protein